MRYLFDLAMNCVMGITESLESYTSNLNINFVWEARPSFKPTSCFLVKEYILWHWILIVLTIVSEAEVIMFILFCIAGDLQMQFSVWR